MHYTSFFYSIIQNKLQFLLQSVTYIFSFVYRLRSRISIFKDACKQMIKALLITIGSIINT